MDFQRAVTVESDQQSFGIMQIVTSAVRLDVMLFFTENTSFASAKFVFAWNTGCYSSTLMHRVLCVPFEVVACARDNDELCHIIEMGEAIGTRPLISSRSRCIRSQTTQMQVQGHSNRRALGAGELVSDIHGIPFFVDREDKTGQPRRLFFSCSK